MTSVATISTLEAEKNNQGEESGGNIRSDAKVEKVAPITIKKIKEKSHKNNSAIYEVKENVLSSKQTKPKDNVIISTGKTKDNFSSYTCENVQLQSTEKGENSNVKLGPSILSTKIYNEEYTLYTCLVCGKMYVDKKEATDHLCKDSV